MAIRYKPEVHAYIREHLLEFTQDEMREHVNRIFGTSFTPTGMKAYYSNHKLKAGKRKRLLPRFWTPEKVAFICEHYKGTSYREMIDLFEERFGIRLTLNQVKGFYGRHHLDSGLTGRFVKGQEPPNKGKPMSEWMAPESIERTKATRFHKGNTPHNHLPVGSIVKNTDGYYQKKLAEPHVWKQMQVLTWEEHNGPIPPGMVVCFKDGDKSHYNIENLTLVSRAEHGVMNRYGLRSEHPELTEVGLAIAKVKVAQGKARRRKREQGGLSGSNGGHSHRTGDERMEEEAET